VRAACEVSSRNVLACAWGVLDGPARGIGRPSENNVAWCVRVRVCVRAARLLRPPGPPSYLLLALGAKVGKGKTALRDGPGCRNKRPCMLLAASEHIW